MFLIVLLPYYCIICVLCITFQILPHPTYCFDSFCLYYSITVHETQQKACTPSVYFCRSQGPLTCELMLHRAFNYQSKNGNLL